MIFIEIMHNVICVIRLCVGYDACGLYYEVFLIQSVAVIMC